MHADVAQQSARRALAVHNRRVAQAARSRIDRIEPGGDPAGLIPVVGPDTRAAVVNRSVAAGERHEPVLDHFQRAQPGLLGLLHHPQQRDVAQALVRIAAADIGVHAGEPHLLKPSFLDPLLGDQLFLVQLVPEQRVEGVTLVVDREGVARALDVLVQLVVRHAERKDPVVDRSRDLSDRSAIRRDRVPDADETDLGPAVLCGIVRLVALESRDSAIDPAAHASHQFGRPLETARKEGGTEIPVRLTALSSELGFTSGSDESLRRDQRDDDAYRERAAAEPEGVDVVAVPVVAAGVAIDVENVPVKPHTEGAAQQRQRLERRRADAVVVVGDLIALAFGGRPQVDRLVHPPDVGLEQLGAAVPRAVREEDDRLGHKIFRSLRR